MCPTTDPWVLDAVERGGVRDLALGVWDLALGLRDTSLGGRGLPFAFDFARPRERVLGWVFPVAGMILELF